MIEETVDVAPSEENGNVPLDTPSEETPEIPPLPGGEEEPAVVVEAEDPEPEAELFELPDGRKVDAATLQTEWKENFAPEFTRRSRELAELKKGTPDLPTETPPSPYADPDYVPESYEEILKVAEQRVFAAMEQRDSENQQRQQQAESAVVAQLDAVKKIDPSVDENKLFLHANKYGFRDLSQAHQNMRDMSSVVKNVQQTTAKNIAKRNDPVSISSGGAVGQASDPSMFENAAEYLRSLKN